MIMAVASAVTLQAYTVLSLKPMTSSVEELTFLDTFLILNSMLVPFILLCGFSYLDVRGDEKLSIQQDERTEMMKTVDMYQKKRQE